MSSPNDLKRRVSFSDEVRSEAVSKGEPGGAQNNGGGCGGGGGGGGGAAAPQPQVQPNEQFGSNSYPGNAQYGGGMSESDVKAYQEAYRQAASSSQASVDAHDAWCNEVKLWQDQEALATRVAQILYQVCSPFFLFVSLYNAVYPPLPSYNIILSHFLF
jgi:hypothetical protein